MRVTPRDYAFRGSAGTRGRGISGRLLAPSDVYPPDNHRPRCHLPKLSKPHICCNFLVSHDYAYLSRGLAGWLAGSACWSAYESNSIPVCTQYRFRLACSWKYRYWLSSRLVVPSIHPSVSQSWWFCSPFLMWVPSIYPAHMSILPSSGWLRLSSLSSSNPFGLLARSSSLFTLHSSFPLLLVAFLISTHPRLLFGVALWCGV